MTRNLSGQFEQLVLLAILGGGESSYAILIRHRIEEATGRPVSRGALYRTLDRLEAKGFLCWELEQPREDRGGLPRRRFKVTEAGVKAVRSTRDALLYLSQGLDEILGES